MFSLKWWVIGQNFPDKVKVFFPPQNNSLEHSSAKLRRLVNFYRSSNFPLFHVKIGKTQFTSNLPIAEENTRCMTGYLSQYLVLIVKKNFWRIHIM